MATREQLLEALRAADAAGDAAAARAIARRLSEGSGTPSGAAVAAPVGGSGTQPGQEPLGGMLPKDASRWDKFLAGVGNSGIETYLGGKQLFKDLDKEELSVLEQSRADADSGWGTGGRIAGGVGQAVAGAALAPIKLARTAGILKKALAAAGASGVSSAALTPVEDQEDKYTAKGKEGLKAAVTGGVLSGTLGALKKGATQMFRPSVDAETLMRQGVYPTLAEGAEGWWGKKIGAFASGNQSVEERGRNEIAAALGDRISGGKVDIRDTRLSKSIPLLEVALKGDRDAITAGKKIIVSNRVRDAARAAAASVEKSGNRTSKEANAALDKLENIIGTDKNTTRMGWSTFQKDYLNLIQDQVRDSNEKLTNEGLLRAKILLTRVRNKALTPDELAQLKEVDSRYFDLSRLKEAAHEGANINREGVSIKQLATKYAQANGGAASKTNQELIAPADRIMSNPESETAARGWLLNARRAVGMGTLGAGAATATLGGAPFVGTALAVPYSLSMLGQTKRGARALFGDYGVQKAAKSALESPQTDQVTMANLLRALRDNSSAAGAGLTIGE